MQEAKRNLKVLRPRWLLLGVMGLWLGVSLIAATVAMANDTCQTNGDVNGDTAITPEDAHLALLHFLRLANLDASQQSCADFNADGTVTPRDALCIFQAFLQLPSCLMANGGAARLEAVEGNGVGVVVAASQRLVVRVTDSAGAPVAGVPVLFRMTAPMGGTGGLSSMNVTTGANGQAETHLTVDQRAGLNGVEARVDGLAPVLFTVTGCFDGNTGRLIRVGGNAQTGEPGTELPEPLVVRLEDQYGNPGVGETVAIDSGGRSAVTVDSAGGERCVSAASGQRQGLAAIRPQANGETRAVADAQGEVRFRVRIDAAAGDQDIGIQVSAPDLPQVEPIQFLVIVGSIDTPDIPLDIAVAGRFVFVADRFSGLQVSDVGDSTRPILLHQQSPLNPPGSEARLALAGDQAYVVTNAPARLYIFAISQPDAASFPTQANNDCQPLMQPGCVELPEEVQTHDITGVAVQGNFAYVLTHQRTSAEGEGTLQVINISNVAQPQVVRSLPLVQSRPLHLAVSGNVGYVSAAGGGLLVIDLSTPDNPQVVRAFGAGENAGIASSVVLDGGRAYLVESRCDRDCNEIAAAIEESQFTVLDLSNATSPQRLGTVPIRVVSQIAVAAQIAVAGRFAYLGQFAAGLLVIDINDPGNPKAIGNIDTPSVALTVAAAGDFVYASDQIFGLQVISSPPANAPDADGDGIIDPFDAFPRDPAESRDTDRDRIGDNADTDDDNDGFSDVAEQQANPATDPQNPLSFPPTLPPAGATHIVVDAASSLPSQARNGTEEAPYASITQGIRAVRTLQRVGRQIQTLVVRPGVYSRLTTQEDFPLDLVGLSNITLRSTDPTDPNVIVATVLDAGFSGDILLLRGNTGLTIEGLSLTHGAHGILANAVADVTLRRNLIVENIFDGISLGINATDGNRISENDIHGNGQNGIGLFEQAQATIVDNAIGTLQGNGVHGIFVADHSHADIMTNTLAFNAVGIGLLADADASITSNIIRFNLLVGVLVQENSAATIIGNTVVENGIRTLLLAPPPVQDFADALILGVGIAIDNGSTAVIANNTIDDNLVGGIVVERDSSAQISANFIRINGFPPNGFGIVLFENAQADVTTIVNNTVQQNTGPGIAVVNGSTAEIRGGESSANLGAGVAIFGDSSGDIGPDGNVVTISNNGGAGVFVNSLNFDGSEVGIGSTQDDIVCVLFSNSFPFECIQFAFQYVFGNFGGDFVPPLDYFFGPYFSIP